MFLISPKLGDLDWKQWDVRRSELCKILRLLVCILYKSHISPICAKTRLEIDEVRIGTLKTSPLQTSPANHKSTKPYLYHFTVPLTIQNQKERKTNFSNSSILLWKQFFIFSFYRKMRESRRLSAGRRILAVTFIKKMQNMRRRNTSLLNFNRLMGL